MNQDNPKRERNMIKDVLTAKELQEVFSMTEVTMKRLIRDGLPCFRLQRQYRFYSEDVIKWFKEKGNTAEKWKRNKPKPEPIPLAERKHKNGNKESIYEKAVNGNIFALKCLAENAMKNDNREDTVHQLKLACPFFLANGKECCNDKRTPENCPLIAFEERVKHYER